MTPSKIKELIGNHLDKGEHLPCRVDEMTPREFEIFRLLAERTGFLMYLRDAIADSE